MHDVGEVASMPSLAASSSDTSPEEKHDESAKTAKMPAPEESDSGSAVNTLLMAAYAMTEFQAQSTTTAKSESPKDTKPAAASSFGTPKKQGRKTLIFRASPKRKSEETRALEGSNNHQTDTKHDSEQREDDDSGNKSKPTVDEEEESAATPMDQRSLKRTRLGSARKKNNSEKSEDGTGEPTTESSPVAMLQETPNQKPEKADKLTPVSARCIDFRRMNVNEKQQK